MMHFPCDKTASDHEAALGRATPAGGDVPELPDEVLDHAVESFDAAMWDQPDDDAMEPRDGVRICPVCGATDCDLED